MAEAKRTPINIRRQAFLDAIDWLEYRAAVCAKTEAEWAEKYGAGTRGCATERSARHELQLAIQELARMANQPRRSRAFQTGAAARASFLAEQKAKPTTPGGPDA